MNSIYAEINDWKKPLHRIRASVAQAYLKLLPNLEIIGITGSVGKTLTQNAIASVLSQKFNVVVGDENLDPTFRIPQTILKVRPWTQKLVLEYGVEKPGEMDYYISLAKPKIAVVTTISKTHTKYFKNIDGVFTEKVKLIKSLGKNDIAVLNSDDPNVVKMAPLTDAKVIWFGQNASLRSKSFEGRAKKSVKISHFSQNLNGSKFRLHYNGQKASVAWKIVGQHQLISAYIAATVGIEDGLTLKQVAKGLSIVKTPEHRLNVILTNKVNILDDTYNSSPKAAEESIKALASLGKGMKKIAVLGEMKDLGTLSDDEHKLLGEKIAKSSINLLIAVDSKSAIVVKAAQKAGFRGEIFKLNVSEAKVKLKKIANSKSLILIKGSRHTHLERIVFALLNKPTGISCHYCGNLK